MKEQNPHIDFEIAFFEELINSEPNFIDALIPLAENYTEKGMYTEGLDIDKRLSRLLPSDETVHYNLACSYALTKNYKTAVEVLKKAIELGYNDFNHLFNDPDLECLYDLPEFISLTEKYSHKIHENSNSDRGYRLHRF